MDEEKKQTMKSWERTCPVCGKRFLVPSPGQWIYKKKGMFFDSWTCYQKGGAD